MAIRRETLRLADELRVVVDGSVDSTVRELVRAWARAWRELQPEWDAAIADLVDATGTEGQWPSQREIARARRAQRAFTITHAEVVRLAEFGGIHVVSAAREVTAEVADWQARLIASQMPAAAGDTATLVATFTRVDPEAIGAIVERTTEQIHAASKPLSDDAVEAMRRELVRGVAVGDNPRTTARRMLRRVEGRFNGGLTRAMTIARTEVLDAHRSATAAAQFDNADVLAGWVWTARLDGRTCPSCWSQHGRVYPLTETGPNDHQQGRCARTPKTRTWRELGFDVDEPADLLPDARATFARLGREEQLQIMGPTRLQALDDGQLDWEDLSTPRSTTGWRDSYVPIRVGDARRRLLRPV